MDVGETKKVRIGDVAKMLGISGQTIRNWLKNDELKGLFSEGAMPLHGKQHEFTPEDVQLINSIYSITNTGNYDWRSIAENLRSGWRERNLPTRAVLDDVSSESALGLAIELATTKADLEAERRVTRILEEQIKELRARAAEDDNLRDRLIEAEVELRLYRTGRLKPVEGEGGK